jgi:hypothetical protein
MFELIGGILIVVFVVLLWMLIDGGMANNDYCPFCGSEDHVPTAEGEYCRGCGEYFSWK